MCCFLVLLLVMFLVYLFATLTFAKSSPLFDFGPRDEAGTDVITLKTKSQNDINQWIKRTDKFLEGEKKMKIKFKSVHAPGSLFRYSFTL